MQTQVKEVRSKIVMSMKVFSFLYVIIYGICAMQYEIGMRIGKLSSMIRYYLLCVLVMFSFLLVKISPLPFPPSLPQ